MPTDIVLIALLVAAYLYWRHAQQIKEAALAATRRQCRLCEVQMLDDYVALSRCGLERDKAGKLRILRRFTFEFSATGEDRCQGVCLMRGTEVAAIEMPAYRFPQNPTPPAFSAEDLPGS
ncbi:MULTISPECIES: DUF3301 domain-containing protein [Methylomicrobium]|uniref:DUF3301 domain-containing protein n=1 Tax=Methylomicrobium album BG8 TaxID=686340 RepID=H8GLV2_METAL|nr:MULTISPECIES: DUF3301 domain-containing protein [Methylomicrobium]EIC28148.1 Protein of unknown function (DUF3301) [Methylomicrobium album BG8]